MLARLVHGALLGALLAGIAGLVEVLLLLRGYPYHRDYGLWLEMLPATFLAGSVLGVAVAIGLPLVTRRKDRQDYPGLFLGCAILAAIATLAALAIVHMIVLGPGVPSTSAKGVLYSVAVLGAGVVLHAILALLARSRIGCWVAGFFTPFPVFAGLATLLVLGWLGWMFPVRDAPLGPRARYVPPNSAPNVLLIVMDTVAARHMPFQGYHRQTTPALARLAQEGVVFEKAFSAAPWTLPSHASLFTGLHATTHRTGWEHPRLDDGQARVGGRALSNFRTLAEELAFRGYETCGIAKKAWLSSDTGLAQGFSRFTNFARPQAKDYLLLQALRRRFLGGGPGDIDAGAARIVDRALDWLGGGRGRDQERPFFLFLNVNEAHDPFQPPESFEQRFEFLPSQVPVEDYQSLDQSPPYRKEYICGARDFETHEPDILRAMYDAELLYQDRQLERLFTGLREMDLMEDTILIVTSDHGEEFGEHGVLGHQLLLTDGMLHVPLVWRYPKQLPAGKRVKDLASLVDVYPTVVDLVERVMEIEREPGPNDQALEGVSLLPAILEDRPVRDFILAYYDNCTGHLESYPCYDRMAPEASSLWPHARAITCLRSENAKYIHASNHQHQFFDLLRDPAELGSTAPMDDAARERLQQRRRKHATQLERQLTRYKQRRLFLFNPMSQSQSPDPLLDQQAAVEQLGYVGDTPDDIDPENAPQPPRTAPFFDPS